MKIRGQTVYEPRERILRKIKIDPITKCWNWQGCKRSGYGRLMIGSRTEGTRRSVSAHRYAYEIFIAAIPKGLYICHRCDNPSCVNPEHLFIGTQQENVNDREAKGRNKIPRLSGERHPKAKLSYEKVRLIRDLYSGKRGEITKLSTLFNVSRRSIYFVVHNKAWTNIPPLPNE